MVCRNEESWFSKVWVQHGSLGGDALRRVIGKKMLCATLGELVHTRRENL